MIRVIRSPILTPAELAMLDNAVVLDPDDLDAAIVGVTQDSRGAWVAVYDYDKIVQVYAHLFDTTAADSAAEAYEGALEFVDYNTLRALPYMGERAPWVVRDVEDSDMLEADDVVIVLAGRRYAVVASS